MPATFVFPSNNGAMVPPNSPASPVAQSTIAQSPTTADSPVAGQKRKRDEEASALSPWFEFTKVLVGKKQKACFVHNHILRKVPFFRGCLDADMVEKSEGVVKLPEDDAQAFSHAVHWMYHGKLPFNSRVERCDETESGKVSYKRREHLKLYILAQKLLMEDLQNHVMDIMRVLVANVGLDATCCQLLYDELPEDDKMRKLLMQDIATAVKHKGGWLAWKQKSTQHYPHFAALRVEYMEFAADAVATYPNAKFPSQTPCDWHVHISTPKCPQPRPTTLSHRSG